MAAAASASTASPPAPKKVLITGVSKGLGRALALELASRGHTIIGCSRDQTKLDSLRIELSELSPEDHHLLFKLDVRSNDEVEELARVVVEKKLVPDIVVNNAALAHEPRNMWELDVREFDNLIDTNIKGIANVLRHFIPLMIPRKQGIIVNVSSGAGSNAHALFAPYCASKWGVEGLTKSIAKELPKEIAIVVLDPGVIYTDMLVTCMGDLASQYQTTEEWAPKGATMILDLTTADNGATVTVKDPGILPDRE